MSYPPSFASKVTVELINTLPRMPTHTHNLSPSSQHPQSWSQGGVPLRLARASPMHTTRSQYWCALAPASLTLAIACQRRLGGIPVHVTRGVWGGVPAKRRLSPCHRVGFPCFQSWRCIKRAPSKHTVTSQYRCAPAPASLTLPNACQRPAVQQAGARRLLHAACEARQGRRERRVPPQALAQAPQERGQVRRRGMRWCGGWELMAAAQRQQQQVQARTLPDAGAGAGAGAVGAGAGGRGAVRGGGERVQQPLGVYVRLQRVAA